MRVYDNGRRPQLVIFDLDGTLYPRESYTEIVLDVMTRGLVELKGLTRQVAVDRVEQLRQMMATNWDSTSTTAFILAQGVDARQWQRYRGQHLDIAAGLSRDEGVVAGVADLRRHFPVALLTNNTRALTDRILHKIGFADNAFSTVVSAEDVGAHPKPSPSALQILVDQLQVHASATWGIGDRYDIDIAPLVQLGGAGITISGPDEISAAAAVLVARAADVTTS